MPRTMSTPECCTKANDNATPRGGHRWQMPSLLAKKGHRGYPGECKRSAETVMQNLFIAWLALPVAMLFASLFAFYLATAALLVWLSFRSKLSDRIQSFKGLVAPFFVSTATIFGLLVGFLSNDIWERNKQPRAWFLLRATRCSRFTVSVPLAGPMIEDCAPRR